MNPAADTPFDELMVRHWPGLVRLAYGLTGDRQRADELAQTALARAYAVWWRLDNDDDPAVYLRRILLSECRRGRRHRRLHRLPVFRPGRAAWRGPSRGEPAASPDGPGGFPPQRSALMTALAGLPPQQRAVIVLRYWEDMADSQVAALLGCTTGTVRRQAARALTALGSSAALAAAGLTEAPAAIPAGGAR